MTERAAKREVLALVMNFTHGFLKARMAVFACMAGAAWIVLCPAAVIAGTNQFFRVEQGISLVSTGLTSDTFRSAGYLFTVTRDKLFTGGVGLTNPIGRAIRVPWPDGMEAQAVTAGENPGGAVINIRREDQELFGIPAFSVKLLASTAGAGGAVEVMPMLNGEDGLPDPIPFNASGSYGSVFSYVAPQLTGFDSYKFKLYVDFALTSLTIVDATIPPPSIDIVQIDPTTVQLSWPSSSTGYRLESSVSLSVAAWRNVTNAVVVNGDIATVEVTIESGARFFRLVK